MQGDQGHPLPALWRWLDDDLLVAWYAQNLRVLHPKARPLPIGLEPRWRSTDLPVKVAKGRVWAAEHPPRRLMFVNFGFTHSARRAVNELARKRQWSQWATVTTRGVQIHPTLEGTPYKTLFEAIADHKFVLAVRGNGIDTFRLWIVREWVGERETSCALPHSPVLSIQTLYVGRIPIVVSSAMDVAFEGLPVLILPAEKPPSDLRGANISAALASLPDRSNHANTVADGQKAWEALTPEWLEEQWTAMTSPAALARYDSRRLYAGAWACEIRAAAAAQDAPAHPCDVTAPLQNDPDRGALARFNSLTDLASEGVWRRMSPERQRWKGNFYLDSCKGKCYAPRRWGSARNTNETLHY